MGNLQTVTSQSHNSMGQKVIYSCEITGTDSFQIEIVPEQRNHVREFHVPVDAAILPCVLLFC